jgi:hypothetical protein
MGDQPVEMFDMGAGGDFRHHAAKGGVFLDLREDGVREDFAAPVRFATHDSGRRLVAACLDAQYGQRASGGRVLGHLLSFVAPSGFLAEFRGKWGFAGFLNAL